MIHYVRKRKFPYSYKSVQRIKTKSKKKQQQLGNKELKKPYGGINKDNIKVVVIIKIIRTMIKIVVIIM